MAHYVLVLIAILLMGDTMTYGVILFYPALPMMSPPFTPAQLPWIVSITLLVAGAMQPLMGKLSDVFGRKRLLTAIAVTFILGSLVGALTDSFTLMLVARVLQASAVAMPGVVYSFFREYFPDRMVPIAVGLNATNIGLAAILAPFIAGALLSTWSYKSIFVFCAIYMAVTAPILLFCVPELPRGPRRRVDLAGSLTLTAGIGLLLLGISDGSSMGWGALASAAPLVGGILLLIAFVLVEQRVREPMIDLAVLNSHAMRRTLLVTLFAGTACTSWGYFIPEILEAPAAPGAGFGRTALQVAVVALPFGVASAVCGPLGGWLTKRTSPRLVMLLCAGAGTVSAIGMALTHHDIWTFLLFGALMGMSNGFYFAAGPNLVIEAVPERLTGVSTGMQALSSSLAGSIMPVVITAILVAHMSTTIPAGHTSAGYTWVFAVLAVCTLIATALTVTMRHGRGPATGGARPTH